MKRVQKTTELDHQSIYSAAARFLRWSRSSEMVSLIFIFPHADLFPRAPSLSIARSRQLFFDDEHRNKEVESLGARSARLRFLVF